ncbi:MAG: phosphoglucosamine mutase [Chloroflexota bacterium]
MRLFGTSGIRRVVDESLLSLCFRVGLAVGRTYGAVAVGRDTRTSGNALEHAVVAGLLAAGARCDVLGIVPTPTLAFLTREYGAGVMITASHNPPEYNGVKLWNPDGSSFDTAQQEQIEEMVLAEASPLAGWELMRGAGRRDGAVERHLERIKQDFPESVGAKVVVDAGCGAAALVTPRLLRELGAEVLALDCYPSGFFPRGIEPTAENLVNLSRTVVSARAAVGIAHDGDADRMMAVDEKGRFISGDRLLALLAGEMDAREIVTTLDASMALEEMGFRVRRTPVGDTYISAAIRKDGGDFGGEASGAWVFPAVSFCPDGIYAAALLAALAGKKKLSALADGVPAYPILRGTVSRRGIDIDDIEKRLLPLKPRVVSRIDGIQLDFKDGWLLVRASGTEPKVRLTAEARTEARARELYDAGLKAVQSPVEDRAG